MALSATFTANFSSFYDAVDKAQVQLRDMGKDADKAGSRLNTMADSFSGRKVIQDAELMVKAIGDIENVSKLTDKELKRLGATTNEAVAKMKALGQDVPKNLQAVADKTADANKASTDWLGTLSKMAGAVGIAFSVGAITNFIGSVFEAAGAIKDQSAAVGMSAEGFQRIKFAVEQGGGSLEDFTKAANKLNDGLATGSNSTVAALKAAGLSFQDIRGLKPEDAFLKVSDAVGKIEDPMERARVAQDLFGKGAIALLPGMIEGYGKVAASAKVMSDETINRLEAAGDAWAKLGNWVTIVTGEIIGRAFKQAEKDLEYQKELWGGVWAFVKGGTKGYQDFGAAVDATHKATAAAAEVDKKAAAEKERLSKEVAGLSFRTEAQAAADKKAAEAAEAHRKKIQDLTDSISGAGLGKQVADLAEAYKKLTPAQVQNLDVMLNLANRAKALQEAGATLTPQLKNLVDQSRVLDEVMRSESEAVFLAYQAEVSYAFILGKTTIGVGELTDKEKARQAALAASVSMQGEQIQGVAEYNEYLQAQAYQISVNTAAAEKSTSSLVGLSASLSGSILKAIQGGGSVFQAAGSSIGNFLLDPAQSGVGKAIAAGASKLPGLIGGAVGAAIPVAGALIGPAVGWLAGKIGSFFGKKEYEKIRDAFIDTAGGIAELRAKAEEAGVSLDRLFQAKKTDDIKSAIQDVTDQFAFQEKAIGVLTETAARYGFTLEELGPAMARQELDKQAQQLFKDWEVLNSAGIDTIAITERMGESVSQYVQDAMAMGTDVPEAMRPMLEAMAKSGELVDKNGDAITDLEKSGISFALSMSDGFKAMIGEVRNLTDVIARSLGTAIRTIPEPQVRGRVSWDVDDIRTPAGPRVSVPGYARGTDGFENFGAGTPVVLHGWEAVVPRDDAGAFATVAGAAAGGGGMAAASGAPTIIINAQGAFFETPESLQRLAGKVSAALTAKYSVMGKLRAAV